MHLKFSSSDFPDFLFNAAASQRLTIIGLLSVTSQSTDLIHEAIPGASEPSPGVEVWTCKPWGFLPIRASSSLPHSSSHWFVAAPLSSKGAGGSLHSLARVSRIIRRAPVHFFQHHAVLFEPLCREPSCYCEWEPACDWGEGPPGRVRARTTTSFAQLRTTDTKPTAPRALGRFAFKRLSDGPIKQRLRSTPGRGCSLRGRRPLVEPQGEERQAVS